MRGVFAAALTPFGSDGAPDMARMGEHCRWLLANGCDGLAVLGTTGEANSLSLAERINILDGLVAAGIDPKRLMPGTGSCALPDAISLTKKAVEIGASGALVLPPFYYKNPSVEGLYAFFAGLIEAVGDVRLRIYLYHFPQMAGVPIPRPLIERLLKEFPSTVVGMKDSSGDFEHMAGIAKDFPGFSVFAGADHLLLPILEAGGVGCITAIANIAAPLAAKIYAKRDQAAHKCLSAIREGFTGIPLIAGLKEILAKHRQDQQWRLARPPQAPLPGDLLNELLRRLGETGYQLPDISRG
jgi:4-hydroxy-tetrahydrodipicolinate synthase